MWTEFYTSGLLCLVTSGSKAERFFVALYDQEFLSHSYFTL